MPGLAAEPPTLEVTLAELVERAGGLAARGRRTLLGITGAPGSGKSWLAESLQEALGELVAVAAMDGFHLAQQELERLGRAERKGAPDTFDCDGYAALLRRLRRRAEPVTYAPLFRRDLEEPVGSAVPIPSSTPLVIAEGNYLLLDSDAWPAVREQLDEVWFLDVAEEIRVARLTARHEQFGKDAAAARAWATGTDQRNAELIEAGRHRATAAVRLIDG